MGLFDKKYCDVCGEKIGLLGNRKLEDGNLCKDCAKKLSPFFSDRRNSTVEEIKAQLDYRKENEKMLDSFHPDRTYGSSKMIYVDSTARKFIVSYYSNWKSENPDIISFDMVKNVQTNIEESKHELTFKDENGEEKSYSPPRYEYEYSFYVTIFVDSPWFDSIKVELTSNPYPESPYSPEYRKYEFQTKELVELLTGQGAPIPQGIQAPAQAQMSQQQGDAWTCACGATNSGKFCESCGNPKPEGKPRFCGSCGWKTPDPNHIPKFCPECGKPLA